MPTPPERMAGAPARPAAARLVVAAPLRVEAYAVRRGLAGGGQVVRVGFRGRRQRRLHAALHGRDDVVLVVAGVAGALVPGLRPGDVVVATEVRSAAGTLPCPAASTVAAALWADGAAVHLGPLWTADHLVHGRSARQDLAACGALAVDMESFGLLRAAGRPAVVVRAVVDTPDRPLLHPATVTGGLAALRALGLAARALSCWAAAAGTTTVTTSGEGGTS